MSKSLKILIVAGGLTHERDVSLRSGRRVANILRNAGHTVEICDLNGQFLPTIIEFDPDLVWPLIHGSVGEDGSVQDLIELVGYCYVGSDSATCHLASSKPTAKALVSRVGIATPDWVSFTKALFQQVGGTAVVAAIVESLSFPLMVKPTDGGSALGLSKVTSEDELRSALVDAFAYGDAVLIEEFIEGRELAVSIVEIDGEVTALPAVEIATDDGRYDFDARYNTGRSKFFVPARIPEEVVERAAHTAVEVHRELGLSDLSRIDLMVDREGRPWFIDANVVPGMTDTSLFPQAADAHSSFAEILDIVAASALADVATQRGDVE